MLFERNLKLKQVVMISFESMRSVFDLVWQAVEYQGTELDHDDSDILNIIIIHRKHGGSIRQISHFVGKAI